MNRYPKAIIEDKTWDSVVKYIDARMETIRRKDGKFNLKNNELYRLKKAMSEVDTTITNVGETFNDHENTGYDTKEGAK